MSLSYKGENIPKMYDELIRLRAQLEGARDRVGGLAINLREDEANHRSWEKFSEEEENDPGMASYHQGCANGLGSAAFYVEQISETLRELENGGGDE